LKEVAEAVECAKGLGLVSLGEVDADEGGLGALAQRISSDGCTGGGRGVDETPHRGEAADECLQRVETELAPVLGLAEDPVVIPEGQEIKGEASDRRRTEVSIGGWGGSEKAVGKRPGVAEIDHHALGQLQT
jgi:hypothetical protein